MKKGVKSKASNSRLHFENSICVPLKCKRSNSRNEPLGITKLFGGSSRSQAEVISTVLLILIAIVAVGLISTFIVRTIRENLTSTECFKTQGQLSINIEDGFTFFNLTSNRTYITIERGQEELNFSGINIVLEGARSRTFELRPGKTTSNVFIVTGSSIDKYTSDAKDMVMPTPSNPKETYMIDSSSYSGIIPVNKIRVFPILTKACEEGKDEKNIPSYD